MQWSNLRIVNDDERGCGDMQDEGFYAHGALGSSGILKAWTWCLGQHIFGGENFTFKAPARQMQVINLPASLYFREVITDPEVAIPDHDHPLARIPRMALLDHIGSEYYTPDSFAEEVQSRGPNRRITEDIAKAIAGATPIPILFTHSGMPLVDVDYREDLLKWADDWGHKVTPRNFEPTPYQEDFGLTIGSYSGNDHWLHAVLGKMHQAGNGKEVPLRKIMGGALLKNTSVVEQTLGISWITSAIYVAPPEADPGKLDELASTGIEPVRRASAVFGADDSDDDGEE